MSLADDVIRIHLYRKFLIRTSMSGLGQSRQNFPENRKGQYRWGTASYVKRIDIVRQLTVAIVYFLYQRRSKSIMTSVNGLRIEVTISTEASAKRYVDINHLYLSMSSASPSLLCEVYASTV